MLGRLVGPSLEQSYRTDSSGCPTCQSKLRPLLIAPTHLKDYLNPHLAQVWYEAEQVLREASRVVFIGYSLPEDDVEVTYLLKRSMAHLPPGQITVVEYDHAMPPQRFVHETTEDEKFTGRLDMLGRLGAWAADTSVRLVAISALGGLGKTALIGKWLRSGAHRRQGVFFWSFYRERETARMVETLKEFAQPGSTLAIALDGLEVIQNRPAPPATANCSTPRLRNSFTNTLAPVTATWCCSQAASRFPT